LESKNSELQNEDAASLNASLLKSNDGFDAAEFELQYQAAKRAQEKAT
jgi:hypothetical protein